MAMRCFGRARFTGADARPLLASFLRADDFATALRAVDFFCAGVFAAARVVGFLADFSFADFLLGFFATIDVLPFLFPERLARIDARRVRKGAPAPMGTAASSRHHRARCSARP
jgi:hypothetical protein